MLCQYREHFYICGNYVDIDVYPVFRSPISRSKKARPSSPVQNALNDRRAKLHAKRLINTNFSCDDIKLELTYRDCYLPETPEIAQRELANFFRRVKRFRRTRGLPEIKYFASVERGSRGGRLHHHVIMSGGLLPQEIAQLWGRGYVLKIQPLQFDEAGCVGLAKYFTKDKLTYKRFTASRNLRQPEEHIRTGAVSQRTVRAFAECPDDRAAIDAEYASGKLSEFSTSYVSTILNDYNNLPYIAIRMYRRGGAYAKGFEPGRVRPEKSESEVWPND